MTPWFLLIAAPVGAITLLLVCAFFLTLFSQPDRADRAQPLFELLLRALCSFLHVKWGDQ